MLAGEMLALVRLPTTFPAFKLPVRAAAESAVVALAAVLA